MIDLDQVKRHLHTIWHPKRHTIRVSELSGDRVSIRVKRKRQKDALFCATGTAEDVLKRAKEFALEVRRYEKESA